MSTQRFQEQLLWEVHENDFTTNMVFTDIIIVSLHKTAWGSVSFNIFGFKICDNEQETRPTT